MRHKNGMMHWKF